MKTEVYYKKRVQTLKNEQIVLILLMFIMMIISTYIGYKDGFEKGQIHNINNINTNEITKDIKFKSNEFITLTCRVPIQIFEMNYNYNLIIADNLTCIYNGVEQP